MTDFTYLQRKRDGEDIVGTTVGRSVIAGAISALERARCADAHKYPDDAEARLPLRSDDRIRRAEAAVKHREPERVAMAQNLKAAGSSAGTSKSFFFHLVITNEFTRYIYN